ncbi:MAG: hypothetical protein R3C45_00610 [Phycisphaerales bacterium]
MMVWAMVLIFLAVPPLSDAQQEMLATAIDDGPQLDGAALYPLVENALQWDSHDESDARVPDYDVLLSRPAEARGGLFLIEGQFAGRARRFGLVRSGAWGEALTEWVLLVRDDPEEVAVVYFVDPDGTLEAPAIGAGVRAVGRFYKVWADRDRDGTPARYLTFIARSPKVLGTPAPEAGGSMLPMLLLVAVLGVVYVLIRRIGKPDRHGPRTRSTRHRAPDDVILSDPAEALERLAERRDPS